jgi:hypothetical protein
VVFIYILSLRAVTHEGLGKKVTFIGSGCSHFWLSRIAEPKGTCPHSRTSSETWAELYACFRAPTKHGDMIRFIVVFESSRSVSAVQNRRRWKMEGVYIPQIPQNST